MTDGKIHIKIITTEKIVYEDDVDAIYTQGESGSFGILYNHVPFMSALKIGLTKIIKDGQETYYTTMGGVFQVKDNDAVILTTHAENSKDIDLVRAKEAKERAENRLKLNEKNIDVQRAELALAKAIVRIRAVEK